MDEKPVAPASAATRDAAEAPFGLKADGKPRKRPPTKGSFTVDSPGAGRGHKTPPRAAGAEVLADLERAYTTGETEGDSPGVKQARKLIREDYSKFLSLYVSLKKGGGEKPADESPNQGQAGPQEEKVSELAERLMREWEDECHKELSSQAIRSTPSTGAAS